VSIAALSHFTIVDGGYEFLYDIRIRL